MEKLQSRSLRLKISAFNLLKEKIGNKEMFKSLYNFFAYAIFLLIKKYESKLLKFAFQNFVKNNKIIKEYLLEKEMENYKKEIMNLKIASDVYQGINSFY